MGRGASLKNGCAVAAAGHEPLKTLCFLRLLLFGVALSRIYLVEQEVTERTEAREWMCCGRDSRAPRTVWGLRLEISLELGRWRLVLSLPHSGGMILKLSMTMRGFVGA